MGANLSALIPELRPYAKALVDIAGRAGLQPRVTSTRRTRQEQTRLYRRFQSGQQPYPVAPPGQSAHEYGYAFDMVIAGMNPEDFADLGQVWQSWGGVWGGALNDPIHFEYPGFSAGRRTADTALPSAKTHPIAEAADFIISFVPYIGMTELAAELLKLGYPESKVLQFLSGPIAYMFK